MRLVGAVARVSALSLGFAAALAHGAEAPKPFAAPAAEQAAPAGGLVEVTLSLLLVLAAVFVAAWLMRRLRGVGRGGAGAIEILATVALGARERVVLIQVGREQLLLGVTANQVNTLHVLAENAHVGVDGENGAVRGQNALRGQRLAPGDFKAILKRSLGL
jgi:flagellar protein FliO/FliZ